VTVTRADGTTEEIAAAPAKPTPAPRRRRAPAATAEPVSIDKIDPARAEFVPANVRAARASADGLVPDTKRSQRDSLPRGTR
jgi:hypothetical protein